MSINPSQTPGYIPPQPEAPKFGAAYTPAPAPSGNAGLKFAILFGVVVALVAANVYLFMQVNKLKTDLNKAQTDLSAELDKVRETTSVTTQSNRRTVESLRDQLQSARRQAAMAAGEAKVEALKKVDETRQRLESAQAQA